MRTPPRGRVSAAITLLTLVSLGLSGCIDAKIGDLGLVTATVTSEGSGDTTTGTTTGGGDTTMGSTTTNSSSDSATDPCTKPLLGVCGDLDNDSIGDDDGDNAPSHPNSDQSDADSDGIGDVGDLCPLLASAPDEGDSDHDGEGNSCDRCPSPAATYNLGFDGVVPPRLWVRPGPLLNDHDGDGIGDACDNCINTANCGDYDLDSPHQLGDPIPEDPALCQTPSVDNPFIGAACLGVQGPGAAGPVGFGPTDDFDQDGLINDDDSCPRDPVAQVACVGNSDCPSGSVCHAGGVCTHSDHDGDGVGDRCDTCPYQMNPAQVTAEGWQVDDADGDRIGFACEANTECAAIANPRPTDFRLVSVGGACCTTLFPASSIDPDQKTILADCTGVDNCRQLPDVVLNTPGVVTLPPGCDEALAVLGITKEQNQRLTLDHPLIGGSLAKLADYECVLPPLDQDFDGLPDACDTCPFAFDPFGIAYIDDQGNLSVDEGEFCSGPYDPDLICQCLAPD